MFQKKFVAKIETHFSVQYIFSLKNRAACEIMYRTVVERGRPQMTIEYGASAVHAGYLRIQTHTQNM